MNLSWYNATPFSSANNLIDDNTLIDSVYGIGAPGSQELTFWIVNNGNELPNTVLGQLLSFGLYIDSDKPEDKNRLLDLANIPEEGSYPYGLYLLFGWTGADIETADRTEFSEDPAVLEKFKVTWTKGNTITNPILLSEAYTYNGTIYTQRANLGINEGSLDTFSEGKGSLAITLRLVVPPSDNEYAQSFLSKIRINATCIKEI